MLKKKKKKRSSIRYSKLVFAFSEDDAATEAALESGNGAQEKGEVGGHRQGGAAEGRLGAQGERSAPARRVAAADRGPRCAGRGRPRPRAGNKAAGGTGRSSGRRPRVPGCVPREGSPAGGTGRRVAACAVCDAGAASALRGWTEETGRRTPGCAQRPQLLSLRIGNVVLKDLARGGAGRIQPDRARGAQTRRGPGSASPGGGRELRGGRGSAPATRPPAPRPAAPEVSNEACSSLFEANPRIFTEKLKIQKKIKSRNHS